MVSACHSIARWLTQAGRLVAILYDSISSHRTPGFDAKGPNTRKACVGCSKKRGAGAAWLSAWSILHRQRPHALVYRCRHHRRRVPCRRRFSSRTMKNQHGDLRYATPETYFLLAGAICFSRVRNYLCASCSAIRSISERVTPISANSRSLRCESSRLTVSWRLLAAGDLDGA